MLGNDAGAHVATGQAYQRRAKENRAFLPVALREFEEAISINPASFDALLGYAYTFWQWRVRSPRAGTGPTIEMGAKAETAARKAVALVSEQASHADEALARATLGEVLLGLGRPEEAIDHLEKALERPTNNDFYDEVRWDLAQAYKCAAYNDERSERAPDRVKARRAQAAQQLDRIRTNEAARNARVFLSDPDLLDPAYNFWVCVRAPEWLLEKEPGPSTRYALDARATEYKSHLLCKWLGVGGVASNSRGTAIPRLTLHVWGGGIDRSVSLDSGSQVFLSAEPKDRWDYYFVQLEDESRVAVSRVYSFETFANDKSGGCPKNHIRLVFRQTS